VLGYLSIVPAGLVHQISKGTVIADQKSLLTDSVDFPFQREFIN
jgi:hypothetical protein